MPIAKQTVELETRYRKYTITAPLLDSYVMTLTLIELNDKKKVKY